MMINGKVDEVNVLAYACFCLIYQINQIFAFATMYLAQKACLNKGVVSTVWSFNPLFISFYDRLVYKTKLSTHHFFGFILLICTSLLIGFSTVLDPVLVQPSYYGTTYVCAD